MEHQTKLSLHGGQEVLKGWALALAVLAKLLKFSCLTCVCLGAVSPGEACQRGREHSCSFLSPPSQVPAAARAGAIAPCDVTVPAQNTGLGPEKTSFFQALGITTKISRGTIEILVSEL